MAFACVTKLRNECSCGSRAFLHCRGVRFPIRRAHESCSSKRCNIGRFEQRARSVARNDGSLEVQRFAAQLLQVPTSSNHRGSSHPQLPKQMLQYSRCRAHRALRSSPRARYPIDTAPQCTPWRATLQALIQQGTREVPNKVREFPLFYLVCPQFQV